MNKDTIQFFKEEAKSFLYTFISFFAIDSILFIQELANGNFEMSILRSIIVSGTRSFFKATLELIRKHFINKVK